MFGREWTDDVPLSFRMGKKDNDREISEWYNEVKLGRQTGICRTEGYKLIKNSLSKNLCVYNSGL